MAQHDYVIDNNNGATVRSDINALAAAAVSLNSGSSAPSTTYAYMLWADTTAGLLKQRNAANSAWQTLCPLITRLMHAGAEGTIASATTTDLGSVAPNCVQVTGTTTITSFGSSASADNPLYFLRFSGALQLTHNATSLVLPTAANITTAVGDFLIALYRGSGNWTVLNYFRASGAGLGADMLKATYDPANINQQMVGTTAAQTLTNKTIDFNNNTITNLPATSAFKNKIINGDMVIAQRGTTFTGLVTSNYCLDRWRYGGTNAAVLDFTQNADVPSSNEFLYSLRSAVTAADASIAAGDLAVIQQRVEGFNVRDLIGRTFTISFWVRSAKTGTHCVAINNSGFNRAYIATYTISAANTWEKKTITITGGLIIAGTWDWTSGTGLELAFCLAGGSTYQATAGAWQTGNFYCTSAQVNCLDTIGNIFALAGVQLEAGSSASDFEHIPYGQEIEICKRYYMQTPIFVVGGGATRSVVFWPCTMRVAPTISGGGAGFSATNVNVYSGCIEQTTGGLQTLTFNSEL